jgi:hypothetical protein
MPIVKEACQPEGQIWQKTEVGEEEIGRYPAQKPSLRWENPGLHRRLLLTRSR